MPRRMRCLLSAFIILIPSLALNAPTHAQGPCGTVDAITYPVDPGAFSVVYPYGMPSSRHDGRYHAGEDWFAGRGTTYGQPVRAAAKGRVTYAAPLGWGRDKGVVIIEHLMPDGTWWYSLYGHMEEVGAYVFPAVYTCVNQGDIIGAVGRPRPAPHLHFEFRNFGSDSPGPGYWGTDPDFSGWRNPSKFIENWGAWLQPTHAWHADLTDEAGPHYPAIIREDNATIVYDDMRLKALNPAGQVLWRYILPATFNVVGMMPYQGQILVADRSGLMQLWSLEGGFIEQWQPSAGPVTAAFTWGNLLVTHDSGANALIAYGPDRAERWRVPAIGPPITTAQTNSMLAVLSTGNALTFLSPDGRVLDRAVLRAPGRFAPAPDHGFYASTQSALWHVDTTGMWRRLADTPAVEQSTGALGSLADGRFVVFTGTPDRRLIAHDPSGQLVWETVLDSFQGAPFLLEHGGTLLAVDGYGAIAAVSTASGALCAELDVWGKRAAGAWAEVGPDGILRVHIADQMIGLDWHILTASCS